MARSSIPEECEGAFETPGGGSWDAARKTLQGSKRRLQAGLLTFLRCGNSATQPPLQSMQRRKKSHDPLVAPRAFIPRKKDPPTCPCFLLQAGMSQLTSTPVGCYQRYCLQLRRFAGHQARKRQGLKQVGKRGGSS